MTLQDLGALGELVGAIAVVVSIIYLAVQIRQNTRALQGTMYQSIINSSGDFNRFVGGNRDLAELWMRAGHSWDDLEHGERAQMVHLWHHNFRLFENIFFQHTSGTLAPELWAGWRDLMVAHFHAPGVQQWWSLRRRAYSVRFRAFLEESEAPLELPAPENLLTKVQREEPRGDMPADGGVSS